MNFKRSEPEHARLGPSAASTWLNCPGSVLAVEALPVHAEGDVYSDEGTAAHELAFIRAGHLFGLHTGEEAARMFVEEWKPKWGKFLKKVGWLTEVQTHVEGYLELIQRVLDENPGAVLMLERRLDAGVPESWGTGDCVILTPTKVIVIDLKYGAGVRVYVENNPQLKLYGAGALKEFGDLLGTTETVEMCIYQPRIDDGHTDWDSVGADELRAWIDDVVVPTAKIALLPGAPMVPGDKQCRWCDLSGRCPAQMSQAFSQPFNEPTALTPEEIAEALKRAPQIRQWLASLEKAALTMAYEEEQHIPGFKVVKSNGQRRVDDEVGALAALRELGFTEEQISVTKILGIGALEKLLGKADFATVMPPFLGRTEGKPSLVPDTDSRESINPNSAAAALFSSLEETE